MTTVLALSQEAMRQVHAFIGGGGPALAEIVARTREARISGDVVWRGALTPATIHGIGALSALAADEGARTDFTPDGLNERELAFLNDYRTYGPAAAGETIDGGAGPKALLAAASEAAYAVWQMRPRRPAVRPGTQGGRAVIIGAYGGDHVGDTAILGGVLLHLNKAFGITAADVMSHRPAHTRRLVQGLASPVDVAVHDYTPAMIGRRMQGAALLVVAGGPMMDLPRVLAKHLAAVNLARALGIPFHVERVGVGPFKRGVSRWAARKLFEKAESISLRTAGAGKDPSLDGLSYTVRRDPAFDYLETRTTLDRTTAASDAAAALLAGTKGRRLIGLNLRPIRHAWSNRGEDFSRNADARFLDELCEGMIRVAAEADRPVTYVFFPMNPIEFGMSDLAAAYRLHRRLGGEVDLRVLEADPDIDDVLWLLRKMDAILAMRFHAAIFGLSQGVPTFGFDYYPGQGGKVEQLFADFGRADDAVRMDLFTADWLARKLKGLAAPRVKAEQHG